MFHLQTLQLANLEAPPERSPGQKRYQRLPKETVAAFPKIISNKVGVHLTTFYQIVFEAFN